MEQKSYDWKNSVLNSISLKMNFISKWLALLIIAEVTLCWSSPAPKQVEPLRCKFTNSTCKKDGSCEAYKDCPIPQAGRKVFCSAVWTNNSGLVDVAVQDCWLNQEKNYSVNECVDRSSEPGSTYYICYCDGDMCNANFKYEYIVRPSSPPELETEAPEIPLNVGLMVKTGLFSLIPLVCIAVVLIIMYYLYRRHKSSYDDSYRSPRHILVAEDIASKPLLNQSNAQLLEVKARGRFGCVWKAQIDNKIVAVKVFPISDRQSYNTERDFYNLPLVGNHDNILQYITADQRSNGSTSELWLISEYHENGSLFDYLKANIITWPDLLKIAHGIATGLAYLHEEIPRNKDKLGKPSVAHRDLKSKNILLKKDLTACIGDFGLALKFEPKSSVSDTHGQVGTRRYMAPEVLEGAINFNQDSFLRIDLYACGLVLWECASRCSAQDGPVDEFRLPFEEEVGCYPTLDDMQDCVVQKKSRPTFKETWLKHKGMASYANTVDECWDHDPDARLSAGCVQERIKQLIQWDPLSTRSTSLHDINVITSPLSLRHDHHRGDDDDHVHLLASSTRSTMEDLASMERRLPLSNMSCSSGDELPPKESSIS